ncbi:MAG: hypothetical protein EI684_13665 [Candidatus Viridilinea halotolerans]|uniref:Uncharacterized protein n=1 Tax=Candidatus Viridilinea halotolerans TaxID=2491704 RepID=A0A426TX66_9CHLR|nr:MAG: hypothetical protein EI684_13665 [Candidatus Viridilinea halotolerans]
MRHVPWLNGLLLAALPGALLACTLHCLLASYFLHYRTAQTAIPSPFLCGHMLEWQAPMDTPAPPPPLNPAVLQGLIQAMATTVAGLLLLLILQRPLLLPPLHCRMRLAEPPPAPPPQGCRV